MIASIRTRLTDGPHRPGRTFAGAMRGTRQPRVDPSFLLGILVACRTVSGTRVRHGITARTRIILAAIVATSCVAFVTASSIPRYAVKATGSRSHYCAILNDGSLFCWGNNDHGQLGDGNATKICGVCYEAYMGEGCISWTTQSSSVPIQVDIGARRTAKHISTGASHSCAILDDDSLVCWGANCAGQLGTGDTTTVSVPTKVDLGENKGAKMVSASLLHTCAIRIDGELFCWGDNGRGKLGIGSTTQTNSPTRVDLGTGLTAKFISCAYHHGCAILSDDTVKCWGWGGNLGQGNNVDLGDGPNEMGDNLPTVDLGTSNIAQSMLSGWKHTCVLLIDGRVKCWGGGNSQAPHGNGDASNWGDGPGETGDNLPYVQLGTGRTVKRLADGYTYSSNCVILDDDSAKCWGYEGSTGNGPSQTLGDDPNDMGDNLPTLNFGNLTVKDVSMGSCAILSDDSVKCWGYNEWANQNPAIVFPPPPAPAAPPSQNSSSPGATSTSCSSGNSRATGGTVTTVGDYTIHTFMSDGSFQVTDPTLAEIDVLVVGGGGGGGRIVGGGGGGGGVLHSAGWKRSGTTLYNVTVGYGGSGATFSSISGVVAAAEGGQSSFDDGNTPMTAFGGIRGLDDGEHGAAHGGACGICLHGPWFCNGVNVSEVFNYHSSYTERPGGLDSGTNRGGGGGAGAGQAALATTEQNGTAGGNGIQSDISGTATYYGGGGGGAHFTNLMGAGGGLGGGGQGTGPSGVSGGDGLKNSGGGGGGGGSFPATLEGGSGGSGVVIVRYKSATCNNQSCATDYYHDGASCVACPIGSNRLPDTANQCLCPKDYHRKVDGGMYSCAACAQGTTRPAGDTVPGGTATTCSAGSSSSPSPSSAAPSPSSEQPSPPPSPRNPPPLNLILDDEDHASTHQGFFLLLTMTALNFLL